MTLRPFGIVQAGELQLGLEVVREEGRIIAIHPHRGVPDPYILSVPFVNAHSHLEYRGMQGKLEGLEYWPWIRELTRLKALQTEDAVREDCRTAAQENRKTGVALIGEHSDRPFSGAALGEAGIRGVIFQEVITFFERENPYEKLKHVAANALENGQSFQGAVTPSPHSLFTVDRATLASFGKSGAQVSMHVAESVAERAFFESGEGAIADFYRANGTPVLAEGLSPVQFASKLGLVRALVQFVHGCDLSASEIGMLAAAGVSIAHCPRSNRALGCPPAPIRALLKAGVPVGLGLDSAASGGPIDMFAEMRAALETSEKRGEPIRAEDAWNMATTMGARSLGFSRWSLEPGYEGPLLFLAIPDISTTEDLIAKGSPEAVHWLN